MAKVPDWLIYALICSILYGFWGFFGNLATKYIDYQTAFVYEAIGATLMTFFILFQTKNFSFQGDVRGILFAMLVGICGTVASLVFFIALSKGEVANIVSVTSIYPLITIVLSSIFLKEAITFPQMLAVLFAIIAVILSAY
ncbi:EamA family transporter [Tychonema sp. BBK16]|uniref:EamA family transporter n=1 Tax=Tychonema sp. BBK16 TaxID=2699888 RepID=UPI001F3F04E6|nr:EamA family transporter [Tychonema sp. BBK16]MCF6374846.1 EamA family transporter [Tychonema sp. BBK16]